MSFSSLIQALQLFLISTTHHIAKRHQVIKVMAIVKMVTTAKISSCLFQMAQLSTIKREIFLPISSASVQHLWQLKADMVALET
jgi:hypothetical protein